MTVSIIIVVKTWQKNLEECVAKCLELDFRDFEIIILPDAPFADNFILDKKVSILPTGNLKPAQKRDMALNIAKGEILAFLDDDAYPVKDWLSQAMKNFTDSDIAAVGGPAVTPESDTLSQRVSGSIYSSLLVSGNFIYRYLPKAKRFIDDYPSCNLLVRRSIMQELGGFNTKYWPGEDTKLCLDITKKLEKRIIYDPKVLVYHHRRSFPKGHFKQIASYAMHRGFFVKEYPETSIRISYFLPSILAISAFLGAAIAAFFPAFARLYFGLASSYLILVFIFSLISGIKEARISKHVFSALPLIFIVFVGIIITHFAYGLFFLKGLISNRLRDE